MDTNIEIKVVERSEQDSLHFQLAGNEEGVWLAREQGVPRVLRHDPDNPRSLSNDRVRAIMQDDAQRLWIATADGLNLFDHASQTFVRYGRDSDNPHSLRDDDVMSLYQDRGGVLWVGTRAGGASHWSPRSWALGHYRSALISNSAVNAFADDGDRPGLEGYACRLVPDVEPRAAPPIPPRVSGDADQRRRQRKQQQRRQRQQPVNQPGAMRGIAR